MVGSAGDGDSQLAILRVARVLFEAAPSDAAEPVPEWIRKLIAAQASIHERMGVIGDEDGISRAEKILHACLLSRPHALDAYLEVLTAEDRSADSLMALSAVASYAVSLPSYEGKSTRWTSRCSGLRLGGCGQGTRDMNGFDLLFIRGTGARIFEIPKDLNSIMVRGVNNWS